MDNFVRLCLFLIFVNNINLSEEKIPVEAIWAIAGKNATEFLELVVRDDNITQYDDEGALSLWPIESASVDGEPPVEGIGVVAAMLSSPAQCQPKEVAVSLPKGSEPDVFIFPECVSAFRCGGCCGHEMLECDKTTVNHITETVVKTQYSHVFQELVYVGMLDLQIENHTACSCQCKIREEHCDPLLHDYLPDSCRCRCRNELMASACPSNRRWDDQTCACVCPQHEPCAAGEIFNPDNCMCDFDFGDIVEDDSGVVGSNPCAEVMCRAGYDTVPQQDGTCRCMPSDHWGVQAGSAGGKTRPKKAGVNDEEYRPDQPIVPDQPEDTVPSSTAQPTTTRRPRRPRPSSRRNIAARRPRRRDDDDDRK